MRFLIADNDSALGSFLARGFETEGHEASLTKDGEEALERFDAIAPDLVILDLNLPKRDGADVLRAIRNRGKDVPVLILTSRADTETRITCLDLGADDFMAKPFSLRELRARCRALLRRKTDVSAVLRCGALQLNRLEHTVRRNGELIALSNKEFALLECLLDHRGQCVSRATLLERVWQAHSDANTNLVDVYINYLRRKLNDGRENSLIQTVRGSGYAIRVPDAGASRMTLAEHDLTCSIETASWRMYGNSIGASQHTFGVAGQL